MIPRHNNYKSVALIVSIGTILILPIIAYEISLTTSKATAQQVTSLKSDKDKQLETLARSITVKVLSGENTGSGTLIRKQNEVYTVLTNQHVIENGLSHQIQAPDGEIYQAKTVTEVNFGSNDMVLLQFSASQNYTVASLGNLETVARGSKVYVAGFPLEADSSQTNGLVFDKGDISFVLPKPLKGGYLIGYTTKIQQGMSGGPILNPQGQVIGINGVFANAMSFSRPYIYEDDTRPNDDLEAKMRLSSWGVPVEKAALQVVSNNSLARTVEESSVEPIPLYLRQLVEKIDSIAQQVSVLIARENNKNGSGVIIAKKGNTYYVLTAGHVASGKDMNIVTHDGQKYVVNSDKIKNWNESQGLDLALLEFTSSQSYQVATVGNYPRGVQGVTEGGEDRVVFLSGWPASKQPTGVNLEPNREFNSGYLLGLEDGFNLAQNELSFTRGFGLVYSNLSERGMSGGPLLDIEGRLIGIHTAIEGEIDPVLQDSDKDILVGSSLGIPIRTFLAKLEQENIKLNINEQTTLPERLNPAEKDLVISFLSKKQQPQSNADEVEWLNYGNKLWRLRQYEKSLAAFEQAISIKPNSYLAQYSHARTLIRQKNYSEAIESLTKVIKYAENLPESEYEEAKYKYQTLSQAWRQKYLSHFYLGQYEQSLQALDKAIEFTPKDFILYLWKSEVLSSRRSYQEALKAANQAIQNNPDHSIGYFKRAQVKVELENLRKQIWEEKDYEDAIADINKALELNPGNASFYIYKGKIYGLKEDYAKAIEYLKKAIKAEPDFATAYAELGLVYAKQGNEQEFTKNLEKALRLKPYSGKLYKVRGNGYFALKKQDKGIRDYETAIGLSLDLEASPHLYYYWRGLELYKLEDYEGAVRNFDEAIKLIPDNPLYYSNLGNAYFQMGEKQKGIENYDKAIKLDPGSAEKYYSWRGFQLYSQEDNEETIAEINRDPAKFNCIQGYTLFHMGKKKEGIEYYNKAIKLDPESAHLYYSSRGDLLYRQQDYKAALADYNQAIKLKPDNALYYSNRGDLFYSQKDYEKALADYDRAIETIELNPHNVSSYSNSGYYHNLAQYYSKRGNVYLDIEKYQKAIDNFTKAINSSSHSSRGNRRYRHLDVYYGERGNVYLDIEKYQKAIDDFNDAIRFSNNENEKAQYYDWRAKAHYENGDIKRYREDLEKAADLYQQQGKTTKYQTAMEQLEKNQEQE